MATIQIRDIPDDVHRTYKARAAAAGMSLQEYLRAELVENARLRAPAELAAEVQADVDAGVAQLTAASAAAVIRADRDGR
jgi:antitoxin FitA